MKEGEAMAYNDRIETIRKDEFPMLHDSIYLDHAGTTLYPKTLVDSFATEMVASLLGNPHSASASSQYTTLRIENIRHRVLRFFNADPAEYELVFVANATAGIKLVSDAFRGFPEGFDYRYHQACHTSLVGVRQEAENGLCLDSDDVDKWIEGGDLEVKIDPSSRPTLFAYPAQSNMDGRRYPLRWCHQVRRAGVNTGCQIYTLLDAAAYVATSPLDLSNAETAPDFAVVSFYKIFGFPDLGGLIVKRNTASVFKQRRYFGGGTVDMVVCLKEQWHASKTQSLHEALEDGTLPIHSILALDLALNAHQKLLTEFEKLATLKLFHVRTGGVCNPGGVAAALGLEPWEMKRNFSTGFRCGNENDIINGKPTGVIRVSLGAMSTLSDVEKFVAFIEEFYKEDHQPSPVALPESVVEDDSSDLFVDAIMCGQKG
ncbi:hypothetical protein ONZ43_g2688 [Nemania bipapillata]|uniref:Uncharacterized protein n=1 Tax=Nemania bipapillata TaxID=110536 RepID=A0ACC2IZM3_9PEZI|nr:hypothetical protein ONZ43_g2688 [Nemania bipapillata]